MHERAGGARRCDAGRSTAGLRPTTGDCRPTCRSSTPARRGASEPVGVCRSGLLTLSFPNLRLSISRFVRGPYLCSGSEIEVFPILLVGTFRGDFCPRMSGFGVSWRRQRPGWLMTDATHRTSILKNGQQVFTLGLSQEKPEEK